MWWSHTWSGVRPACAVVAVLAAASGCIGDTAQQPSPDPPTSITALKDDGCAHVAEIAGNHIADIEAHEYYFRATSEGWVCGPGGGPEINDGLVSIQASSVIPGGSAEAARQLEVDNTPDNVLGTIADPPWSMTFGETATTPATSFRLFDESVPVALSCEAQPGPDGEIMVVEGVRAFCEAALGWLQGEEAE